MSNIQEDRIPHYEIDWSQERGWRVQVAIHNSTMYSDRIRKVFEDCNSPEHALALANEWVKKNLPTKKAAASASGS
jgi:hypothetical protein